MRKALLLGLTAVILLTTSLTPAFATPAAAPHVAAAPSAVAGFHLDLPRLSPLTGGVSSSSPGIGAFATDNASLDNLGVNTTIALPSSASLSDGQSYMMGVFDYTNSTALAGVGIGVTCVYLLGCTTEAAPVAVMPDGTLEYSTSQLLTMGNTYTLSLTHYRGYWWNFTYGGTGIGTNGTYNLGVAQAQGVVNQGGAPVGPVFVCAVTLNASSGTTTYPPIPTTTIPWAMGVKQHGSSGSATTTYEPLDANSLPQMNASLEVVNIQGHDQVASLHNDELQIGTSLSGTVAAPYASLWGNYKVNAMASVTETPSTAALSSSQPQTFNAQAVNQNGIPIYTAKYHWQASPASLGSFNNSGAGSVVTFTSGTVTEAGRVWVNATYNGSVLGNHSTVSVTVPVTLTSVSLAPTLPSVGPSGSQPFTATPKCSSTCPGTITYAWALTSTKLGTLTGSGSSVTFNAGTTAGTVGIYVNATLSTTTKGSSTTITVTSAPITLNSVVLTPTAPTLGATGSQLFTATPACSATCPGSITYVWSLSSTALGTLSGSGSTDTFNAGSTAGTVGIFVNATLGATTKGDSTVITVTTVTLASVSMTPLTPTVTGGGQQVFTAHPTCSSTCPSSGISYAWSVTNPGLGYLYGAGASITYYANTTAGTAGIFVNATLGASTMGASTLITVTAPTNTLSSATLSPTYPSVLAGKTLNFTAIPVCTSSCPTPDITYAWTLTHSAMGSLLGSGPAVTFTAGTTSGTVGIIANVTLNGTTVAASTEITVKASLDSVTLSPTSPSVAAGQTQGFTASPKCSATCPTPDISYSWLLSSSALGSLSGSGPSITFTAGSTAGTVGIFVNATLNGTTTGSSTTITVTAPPSVTLSSVAVGPAASTVGDGNSQIFTATPTCSSTCPATGITYAWTLSSSSLGTLGGNGASVTFNAGSSAGVVGLFVNATLSQVTRESSAVITVTLSVTLSGTSLSPSWLNVSTGTQATFTASLACTTSDGSSASCPSGTTYSWTLSNTDGNVSSGDDSSPTASFTAGNSPGTVVLTVKATLNGVTVSAIATITISASGGGTSTGIMGSVLVLGVIAGVVVVVAIVAVILLMRRKRPGQAAPPPYSSAQPQGYQPQGYAGYGQPPGAPPGQAPPPQ